MAERLLYTTGPLCTAVSGTRLCTGDDVTVEIGVTLEVYAKKCPSLRPPPPAAPYVRARIDVCLDRACSPVLPLVPRTC
jgi:hypothetical protein